MYTINQKEKRTKAIYFKIGVASIILMLFMTLVVMGLNDFCERLIDFDNINLQTIVFFILLFIVLPLFHESIHWVLLKRGNESGNITFRYKSVTFDGKVSKLRYTCQIISPFIWISLFLALITFYSPGYEGIFASFILASHAAGCNSDLYSFYISLKHWNQISYVTDDDDHVYFHFHED
ncbi:putative membrane protein [Paenibacillus sp. PastF-3]|uniref:DUF3267 domain-containing protein n=1 Tax=Paenibacillus sp. PastF-3 TaxID=2940626 RepID=UPI00247567E3|nr:DUF3267 domain-containing protein [Paenibacillus sp. PastF-3]MDH6373741.1 putative membrane protein [Paenibacillus sp. PastF-3]